LAGPLAERPRRPVQLRVLTSSNANKKSNR
jgi:hypothetical protein